jgi:hypothetical protein
MAIASRHQQAHGPTMLRRIKFDDPEKALVAWGRYRRLMRMMFVATFGMVTLAFTLLYCSNGMVSVHLYIATALGIGFAMLLMSALMGLVFLSSFTGHDQSVIDPLEDESKG